MPAFLQRAVLALSFSPCGSFATKASTIFTTRFFASSPFTTRAFSSLNCFTASAKALLFSQFTTFCRELPVAVFRLKLIHLLFPRLCWSDQCLAGAERVQIYTNQSILRI